MEKRTYGLFTAIAMITGIVIGSGIFFKSDNILVWTGGNVLDGVLVFTLAAIAIIFGSLAISQLATLTDKPGGIITYAEEFCSAPVSCAFGWFQTMAYMPSITAVVAWVAGIYTCILFDLPNTLETQILLGVGYVLLFFVFNVLSAKLGGIIQNGTTIIKLIPLFVIAAVGLVAGDPAASFTQAAPHVGAVGLMSAIPPIAFSFDGWAISTSICHEIKDSKKNLPRALIISPILILLAYVLYFVGISALVGPQQIMSMGDAHVDYAATLLFGRGGAKVMLVFVLISILGTVNGLVLGFIRLPYALGLRNMLPGAKHLKKSNQRLGNMPVNSALFALVFVMLWLFLHYITQKLGLLPNSDVSEISIVTNYLGYIVLYVAVIRLARQGKIKGLWKGYVVPICAIVGALIILMGGLQNPLFGAYMVFCLSIVLAALLYATVNKRRIL